MGTNALFFFVCTGRFNKIWPVVVFRRSLSSPSDRSACVAWLQHAGQWGLQHASSHIRTRNLEEHGFILGCECFFFVLSCDANFVSWENFFPEESEWFCRNQAQLFAQDVCLSTMLLHSSFPTGKIPWKEVSVRNLSFEKIPTEIFVRRKNSCWEACWQEHCCWAVCFVLSGKDVFRETTGKFLGKDPWQQNFRQGSLARKFKFTPSTTTWFSKQICDWKRLGWKGLGDKLFQLRYFFVYPLPGCKKFQILFWESAVMSLSFQEIVQASLSGRNLLYKQGSL